MRRARQGDDANVDRVKHEDGEVEWVRFAVAAIIDDRDAIPRPRCSDSIGHAAEIRLPVSRDSFVS